MRNPSLAKDEVEISLPAGQKLPERIETMISYYRTADWTDDQGRRFVRMASYRWPEILKALQALDP